MERPKGPAAAMLWECRLDEKAVSDVDVAALNEMKSLTWCFGRELSKGIQPPGHLRSLSCAHDFKQHLEGIQLPRDPAACRV